MQSSVYWPCVLLPGTSLSGDASAAPAVGLGSCSDTGRRGRHQPSDLDQVSAATQTVSGQRDTLVAAFSDKWLSVV